VQVLAIELDTVRHAKLQTVMQPYVDRKPRFVYVRQGTLHDRVEEFVAYTEGRPVLYFIDPFGVDTDVWQDLRKLLSGSQNEVFALFSDVGARRLHSVLLSEERDVSFEVGQVLAAPSLFEEMTEEAAEAKRIEVETRNRALRVTQKPVARILSEALGEDSIESMASVPEEERRSKAVSLFMERLRATGAKYVLSLPVRDTKNARVYQLVHASKSKAGVQAMKHAMSEALNSSSLPDGVKGAIQGELQLELDKVVREIAHRFSGREVEWTDGKDRGESDTIKRFLLEDTPAFPWHLQPIKKTLEGGGYRIKGKKIRFSFP